MEDDELAKIRQRRMQELQGGAGDSKSAEEQEKQREQQEMMKNSILSQVRQFLLVYGNEKSTRIFFGSLKVN